jgi:hypothetical protein
MQYFFLSPDTIPLFQCGPQQVGKTQATRDEILEQHF